MRPRTPRDAARRLGHYVYLYVDPRDGRPFYVGKGKGQRGLAHLAPRSRSATAGLVRQLQAAGQEPRIEILAHDLPDEDAALRIEAAVIDALGLDDLANQVRGWRSRLGGRRVLKELIDHYAARPVKIDHSVLLIRVNRLYRGGMPDGELYDATRSAWRLGRKRTTARFALAVFEGVVKAVYEIEEWHPAGSTPFVSNWRKRRRRPDRREFTGRDASKAIRKKYAGRSVAAYLTRGSQNPVRYVCSG